MELLQSLLTLQLRNLILIYNYFNRALLLLNVKLLLCLLYLILLGFDLELHAAQAVVRIAREAPAPGG